MQPGARLQSQSGGDAKADTGALVAVGRLRQRVLQQMTERGFDIQSLPLSAPASMPASVPESVHGSEPDSLPGSKQSSLAAGMPFWDLFVWFCHHVKERLSISLAVLGAQTRLRNHQSLHPTRSEICQVRELLAPGY